MHAFGVIGGKKSGWGICGTENSEKTWESPCGGGTSGAKIASSSTGILLGLPRLLRGGITSIKEDSFLESKLHDTIYEINNLYPLDSCKNRKSVLKIANSDTNKTVTLQPGGWTYGNRLVSLSEP